MSKHLSLCITTTEDNIGSYYKVFGHFFLDHLFQLYKIRNYYTTNLGHTVSTLYVRGGRKLFSKVPFARDLYQSLFSKVAIAYLPWQGDVQLGEVLGSPKGSETSPVYLSLSRLSVALPKEITANGRKLTELNRLAGHGLQQELFRHFDINETLQKNHALILDRKTSPRRLLHIDEIKEILTAKGYSNSHVFIEDFPLREQISMVNRSPLIISACGSTQVHIAFMQAGTHFIELAEPGFRYPNTAIYGHRYGVNTYTLCSSLPGHLDAIRNRSQENSELFSLGDQLPKMIDCKEPSIEREVGWYSKLLSPECINAFEIHAIQDIDCRLHLEQVKKLLETLNIS